MEIIKLGEIKINIAGMDFKEIERYRKIIHLLICQGAFDTKNGKVILHFDNDKELRRIEFNKIGWKK